jgi:hypothetical protein
LDLRELVRSDAPNHLRWDLSAMFEMAVSEKVVASKQPATSSWEAKRLLNLNHLRVSVAIS